MEPQTAKSPLASQRWFIDLMAAKGFIPSQVGVFSNGKATIQLRDNILVADPGDGKNRWKSDVNGANRETITLIVDQLLSLRPFLTDADLAREQKQRDRYVHALDGIAESIRQNPDTGGGVQLRKFLWSLYNQYHLANLWRMTTSLDSQHSAWVAEVFTCALTGVLKDDDLKRALVTSGEMNRWEQQRPGTDTLLTLEDAEMIVSSLAHATLPSRFHTQIADLLRQFGETKRNLHTNNSD